MKFSIFHRLFFSYLFLFSMLVGLSAFFISHFHELNTTIQSIILLDNKHIEDSKRLLELLQKEQRYDKEYLVDKDEELYKGYLSTKKEFNNLLNTTLTVSPESKEILEEIKKSHEKFTHLVENEKEWEHDEKSYDDDQYDIDKIRLTTVVIDRLNRLQEISEKEVLHKINELRDETKEAGSVAVSITVSALFIGLFIALWITRSITKPIAIIKEKTKKIAIGNFRGDLEISSPPALQELALAINTMCQNLQEIDSIKSDFFAHMSHELRTPLSSIQEGTNLLMEGHGGPISEPQERILTIISQESKRLITQVNTILDLAKMEAGMLEYNFMATNLPRLIEQTLSPLMPMAEKKEITISNLLTDLPTVEVDQERMSQVFRNLLANALKFTPEQGTITLAAEIKADHLEITVQNTGTGIPASDLERIFHKFQQGTGNSAEKAKGTGLGLATVRQIILSHKGKVWATSQEGHGSTFHISLPLSS